MAGTSPPLTPKPVFAIKTFKLGPDGAVSNAKVFINVCSLDAVGRPITKTGNEVTEAMLDDRGLDNLQVPIHVGTMWEDTDHKGEKCAVTDVVFHPMVTDRCMAGPLRQHFNKRVGELAIHFVEEENASHGLKLCPQFKLPRMTYKGKMPPKQVVLVGERPSLKAKVKKEMSEEDRKWVEEITQDDQHSAQQMNADPQPQKQPTEKAPLIKKGFLTSAKAPLYPNGSNEGVLPENAGDPLGYLPKGLRNACKIVDPTQKYYQDPKVQEAIQEKQRAHDEFKQSLEESARDTNPDEFLDKLKEFGSIMFPETVPKEEKKRQAEKVNMFGPSHPGDEADIVAHARPSPPIKTLADLGLKPLPKEETERQDVQSKAIWSASEVSAASEAASVVCKPEVITPAATSQPQVARNDVECTSNDIQLSPKMQDVESTELAPQYSLSHSDTDLQVVVQLPLLANMSGVELLVEPLRLSLDVSKVYHLRVDFPVSVQEEFCKAQFNKKKRQLTITIPILQKT